LCHDCLIHLCSLHIRCDTGVLLLLLLMMMMILATITHISNFKKQHKYSQIFNH